MVKKVNKIIRSLVSKINRKHIVKEYKRNNKIKKCTIISSNCVGGMVSHDLGLRFDSPTINLWFDAASFITYVENLEKYISTPFKKLEFDSAKGYPIGYLDDNIKIHFQHYKTVQEAEKKWMERSKRIDLNNLCVICTDRDGMTDDLLLRYLKLPYKKVIFVGHKKMILTEECIYIPGFENCESLPDLTSWADARGHRYYDKYFDIVKWLNKK